MAHYDGYDQYLRPHFESFILNRVGTLETFCCYFQARCHRSSEKTNLIYILFCSVLLSLWKQYCGPLGLNRLFEQCLWNEVSDVVDDEFTKIMQLMTTSWEWMRTACFSSNKWKRRNLRKRKRMSMQTCPALETTTMSQTHRLSKTTWRHKRARD